MYGNQPHKVSKRLKFCFLIRNSIQVHCGKFIMYLVQSLICNFRFTFLFCRLVLSSWCTLKSIAIFFLLSILAPFHCATKIITVEYFELKCKPLSKLDPMYNYEEQTEKKKVCSTFVYSLFVIGHLDYKFVCLLFIFFFFHSAAINFL